MLRPFFSCFSPLYLERLLFSNKLLSLTFGKCALTLGQDAIDLFLMSNEILWNCFHSKDSWCIKKKMYLYARGTKTRLIELFSSIHYLDYVFSWFDAFSFLVRSSSCLLISIRYIKASNIYLFKKRFSNIIVLWRKWLSNKSL